ncbi:MAG: TIGR01212 family radical SAM protein [Campylobacterota bacterium]
MQHILTFGRYLRRKYHTRVYKAPISISGFTCPNIDGTVTKGGCTFCLNDSFSPNISSSSQKLYMHPNRPNPHLDRYLSELRGQYQKTRLHLKQAYGAKKFIVYLQSFTNSYGPFETLKALYDTALTQKDAIGLSIGTRTDSIDEQTLAYLNELGKTYEIWVEYGIQSMYDKTLQRINRGHDFQNVQKWMKITKKYPNINICGHLIYGLPGEDKQMMLESTKASYDLGIDSVKYHPLYIVKNTKLARQYKDGLFHPISKEDYLDILVEAIALKPGGISVQRVSAGFDDDSLIAPKWCRDNFSQMDSIRKALYNAGYIY